MKLWDHQREALGKLRNGSILVGGTGSGKSLTALSYYVKGLGGEIQFPKSLYVITTAKKRDDEDWIREAAPLDIEEIVVDSWNNIKKYVGISDSFFIFDEQRVVGSGTWVKSFIKITRKNLWILLSATPADTWIDLIPVFVANGFYKNRTQFKREHVMYAPYVRYPKIVGYRGEEKLNHYAKKVLVTMPFERHTTSHVTKIHVVHDAKLVKEVLKTRWNPYTNKPISSLPEEIATLRKVINYHPSRILALLEIHELIEKLIIFYNFNFELDMLKTWFEPRTTVGEQNGFRHQPVPSGDNWVYLVQYKSGSEAWECFTTNHMAFYSLNYSYRTIQQARGRINRHNTPYTDLYYYEILSDSFLDKAIEKAFKNKKDFNIRMLTPPHGKHRHYNRIKDD